MKRIQSLIISIALLLFLTGCGSAMTSSEALIEKARTVIPIADAETAEIRLIGQIENEDADVLIWFMSGNEHQAHYYLPMECTINARNAYEYVRVGKPYESGTDIVVYPWKNGYAFVINNPNCKSIQITDEAETDCIEIPGEDAYPYVFYREKAPVSYQFLDTFSNELHQ